MKATLALASAAAKRLADARPHSNARGLPALAGAASDPSAEQETVSSSASARFNQHDAAVPLDKNSTAKAVGSHHCAEPCPVLSLLVFGHRFAGKQTRILLPCTWQSQTVLKAVARAASRCGLLNVIQVVATMSTEELSGHTGAADRGRLQAATPWQGCGTISYSWHFILIALQIGARSPQSTPPVSCGIGAYHSISCRRQLSRRWRSCMKHGG